MNLDAHTMSAVAAACSAVAALLMLKIHRENMFDAAKPELILDGWGYEIVKNEEGIRGEISINKIKNVGRGSALHMRALAHENVKLGGSKKTLYFMGPRGCPILPAGEEIAANTKVLVFWDALNDSDKNNQVNIKIKLYSWDIKNRKHTTICRLIAFMPVEGRLVTSDDYFIENLVFSERYTVSQSALLLNTYRKLSHVRLIGAHVKKLERFKFIRRHFLEE